MSHCKECSRSKQKEWCKTRLPHLAKKKMEHYPKHIGRMRNTYLKNTHGITSEEYEAMLKTQNGVCAICFKPQTSRHSDYLYVDHDHVSGKVRGLLCTHCNMGLGQLKDDPEIMEEAARYIRRHRDS